MKIFTYFLGTAVLIGTLTCTQKTSASSGDFGLGFVLGEPSGITGKYWVGSETAIDFGVAFSLNNYFLIYADYLFHFPGAFGASTKFASHLTPYLGLGARVVTGTSAGIGARLPLGIEFKPERVPLGIFIEVVPGLSLLPGTATFVQGGIGVRYYF